MVSLVVLGGGGHTFEMLRLLDKIKIKDIVFILNHDDKSSLDKIKGKKYYKIIRPRKPAEYSIITFFRMIISFVNSLFILLFVRPKIILTNGPAISISVGLIGKLLRMPIIFVESICRVYNLSLSGRILLPYSNLFLVQWPYLKKFSKKIIYAGRIF